MLSGTIHREKERENVSMISLTHAADDREQQTEFQDEIMPIWMPSRDETAIYVMVKGVRRFFFSYIDPDQFKSSKIKAQRSICCTQAQPLSCREISPIHGHNLYTPWSSGRSSG